MGADDRPPQGRRLPPRPRPPGAPGAELEARTPARRGAEPADAELWGAVGAARRGSARRWCCASSADLAPPRDRRRHRLLGGGRPALASRGPAEAQNGGGGMSAHRGRVEPGTARGSRAARGPKPPPRRPRPSGCWRGSPTSSSPTSPTGRWSRPSAPSTPPSPARAGAARLPRGAERRWSKSSPGDLAAGRRSPRPWTSSSASWRSTSPGAGGVLAAARLAADGPLRHARPDPHLRNPLRRPLELRGDRRRSRQPTRGPGGRQRVGCQPDPDRDPLPPRAPRRWRPRRLRRRAGPQAVPARARGSARAR